MTYNYDFSFIVTAPLLDPDQGIKYKEVRAKERKENLPIFPLVSFFLSC